MKLRRPPQGFTLIELLVVISIIAILASLAVPAVTGAMVKGQLVQATNNARQIYLAAFSMANDGNTNSDSALDWPGKLKSNGSITSLSDYVTRLCVYDYLKPADLKVFSAPGVKAYTSGTLSGSGTSASLSPNFSGADNSAFCVYQVQDSDDSNTIFLSTRNYPSYGAELTGTTPFGDKGFVVCRKAGDVSVYKKAQAGVSGTSNFGKPTIGADPLTN